MSSPQGVEWDTNVLLCTTAEGSQCFGSSSLMHLKQGHKDSAEGLRWFSGCQCLALTLPFLSVSP